VQKLLTHTIQHIERNPFLVSLYEKRKNKKIGSKEKKKKKPLKDMSIIQYPQEAEKEENNNNSLPQTFHPQDLGSNPRTVSVFIRLS
jgi:hypothetical protein